ncbi:MAG: DNA-binding SARP family transcriptional activator [Saprospiraceae bacterium]|jgi:DNA-binding SARP family transcriptional activator
MSTPIEKIRLLLDAFDKASVRIHTLGRWEVWREGEDIPSKSWGRDKTIQLFQFLVTARDRHGLHKEQIIDRIWEDAEQKGGDRDFKVALHGINKILEPQRASRSEPKYILRQGLSYQLNQKELWIDAQAFEAFIAIGNEYLDSDKAAAQLAYRHAISLHQGMYLPNRMYEDWSSEERERLQVLALAAYVTLAESLVEVNPLESVRLTQLALKIDPSWEDAYRIQMSAFSAKGNRPAAIKAFNQCKKVLEEEYGIDPLPETERLMESILER